MHEESSAEAVWRGLPPDTSSIIDACMRPGSRELLLFLCLAGSALAASRQHSIVLGRWQAVKVPFAGDEQTVKVRSLIIDGRLREYTSGPLHEITDQLFVIRKVVRINDSLPQDGVPARWVWRLGGWISIDRATGHIAQLNLPAFDPDASQASWYQDYAAYCGASEDGSKIFLVVWQLGKRKPILRKEYSGSICASPTWDRGPARVSFNLAGEKASFVVHAHAAEPQPESAEEEGPQ